MADGYYSQLNNRLKELKNDGAVCIKRETLASYLDLSEVDREELETRCKNAMAAVILYQNEYRSVERGSGLFLNYKESSNPIFLQKLCDNAKSDSNAKANIAKALETIKNKCIKELPDYAQISLGIDENGNMKFYEEITSQEIIQMLEKIAM